METESRVVVATIAGGGGRGNEEMLVKGDTLSVMRGVSSKDLTHSMVTVVNNTVHIPVIC